MKTQFNLVTQWIADDGTQNTGSDERLISTHSTFADAQKALEKVQIRHPHNHAEIVEVDAPHTAHTTGPWRIAEQIAREGIWIESAADESDEICNISATTVADKEAMANARLIAAAPDLLAALEAAVEYLKANRPKGKIQDIFHELNHYENGVMKPARAAIARATDEKGGAK